MVQQSDEENNTQKQNTETQSTTVKKKLSFRVPQNVSRKNTEQTVVRLQSKLNITNSQPS